MTTTQKKYYNKTKSNKKCILISLALVLFVGCLGSLLGCANELTHVDDVDDVDDVVAIQLLAPQSVRIQDDRLMWDSVDEASRYIVNVNGKDTTTNSTNYTLPSVQGDYTFKVKAIGDNKLTMDSEYSNIIDYHSYGNILGTSRQEGAYGAFDDNVRNDSYVGYGFDVINSTEFSSKMVKMSNPLFDRNKLLDKHIVRQYEHYSSVNTVNQSSMESFITDWSASVSTNADWMFGSASMSTKFGSKDSSTIEHHFVAMDIYNQSFYLVMQIEDIQDYRDMLTAGFIRDLYNVNIDPMVLFDRYGTHFITSAVMGGRINSYYYLQSKTEQSLTEMSAKIDVQVRGALASGGGSAEFDYKTEAMEKNITIKNGLSVMGGSGFGILSDEDIRDNYVDWEQSLKESPALMGIKDRASLYDLWELIDPELDTEAKYEWKDENNEVQTGTRREQLQGFFAKHGKDNYNNLLKMYNIPQELKPQEITGIKIDNRDYNPAKIHYFDNGETSAKITFGVKPETAIGYTKTYTLLGDADKYVTLDNNGNLKVTDTTTKDNLIQVQLAAGGITQIVRIEINSYGSVKIVSVTFDANGGTINGAGSCTVAIRKGDMVDKLQDPVKTNSSFLYWTTTKDGTHEFDFAKPIEGYTAVYAKWLDNVNTKLGTTTIRSDAITVTDTGYMVDQVDFSKYDTNVSTLQGLGYTKVSISVSLELREIDDGYQGVYIYGGTGTDGNKELCHRGYEKNGNWSTESFEYTVDNLADLSSNKFWIRYTASGWFADNWQNKNIKISYEFK